MGTAQEITLINQLESLIPAEGEKVSPLDVATLDEFIDSVKAAQSGGLSTDLAEELIEIAQFIATSRIAHSATN